MVLKIYRNTYIKVASGFPVFLAFTMQPSVFPTSRQHQYLIRRPKEFIVFGPSGN